MKKKAIANNYLKYLERGEINNVIDLFTEDGIVHSPIYGIKNATEFYPLLNNDTSNSEFILKGIFEHKNANDLALYFTYKWTLKNNKKVEFDVVDIIEFNAENKIKTLKIIYDTVTARALINELNT